MIGATPAVARLGVYTGGLEAILPLPAPPTPKAANSILYIFSVLSLSTYSDGPHFSSI